MKVQKELQFLVFDALRDAHYTVPAKLHQQLPEFVVSVPEVRHGHQQTRFSRPIAYYLARHG